MEESRFQFISDEITLYGKIMVSNLVSAHLSTLFTRRNVWTIFRHWSVSTSKINQKPVLDTRSVFYKRTLVLIFLLFFGWLYVERRRLPLYFRLLAMYMPPCFIIYFSLYLPSSLFSCRCVPTGYLYKLLADPKLVDNEAILNFHCEKLFKYRYLKKI